MIDGKPISEPKSRLENGSVEIGLCWTLARRQMPKLRSLGDVPHLEIENDRGEQLLPYRGRI